VVGQHVSVPRSSSENIVTEQQLLQSVVEGARAVFGAAAASIFLVDANTRELVFQAVAGQGELTLPGRRFPSDTGIAGWVAASGQPMLVDDVNAVTYFGRAAAESTEYVPSSIMAAPLIRHDDCIGVLEVLDRNPEIRGGLADVDILGILANQAAIAVELLLRLSAENGAISSTVGSVTSDVRAQIRRIDTRLAQGMSAGGTIVGLLTAVEELLDAPTARR
jgi:GAF domain-containing protein